MAPTAWPNIRRSVTITTREPERAEETIIGRVEGISTQTPDEGIKLTAWVDFRADREARRLVFRLRRGSEVRAREIGRFTLVIAGAAAEASAYDIETKDTPGEVAELAYCLTVEASGATGRSTVEAVMVEATTGIR